MLSLGILSNDLHDLKEESEDITILTDCEDEPAAKKQRRTEGQAFGGTLLGGSSLSLSSPAPAPPSSSQSVVSTGVACPACTYENGVEDMACAMCETPFGNMNAF